MFEQLFGSKTRIRLMRLFLDNPETKFYVRELTRLSGCLLNSVRRELENLTSVQFIHADELSAVRKSEGAGLNIKKYYFLNRKNLFLPDLVNLFAKGKIIMERRLIEKIKRLGDIKYLSLGGIFVDDEKAITDVFVIGDFEKPKAVESLARFEKELGRAIRYTVMDEDEYKLRREIADSFVENILNRPTAIVIINKFRKNDALPKEGLAQGMASGKK